MKNQRKKIVLAVCSLLIAVLLIGCGKAATSEPAPQPQQTTQTETAPEKSPKEMALSAYQEILKAAPAIEGEHPELSDATFGYEDNQKLFGNHIELFALCDLNQDDIPELITMSTVNFRWTPVSVYTFADEKVVLVQDPSGAATTCTFEQNSSANGAYVTYVCEENHIHSVWSGDTPVGVMEENEAYVLDGTVLTSVECAAGETEKAVYFSDMAVENTAENADAMVK